MFSEKDSASLCESKLSNLCDAKAKNIRFKVKGGNRFTRLPEMEPVRNEGHASGLLIEGTVTGPY